MPAPAILVGVLLPLLAAANPLKQLAARDCQNNNCIRAVLGSAFPTRSGSADCASFLKTTVTPATRSETNTATFGSTTLTTRPVTVSTTVEVTRTETDRKTNVVTGPTVTTTITTNRNVGGPVRRQATVSPTRTPAYASACSDVARYVSACSCVYGLTPTVVTVATPVTTVGASTTVVSSTATALTVVNTDTSTVTVLRTVTTTDSTSTVTPPVATATVEGTGQRFRLRVTGGPFDGQWVTTRTLTGGSQRPILTATEALADLFTYDPGSGNIRSESVGQIWYVSGSGGGSAIWYGEVIPGFAPVQCNLDSQLRLQNCRVPYATLLIYCTDDWLGIIPEGQSRGCANLGGVFQMDLAS